MTRTRFQIIVASLTTVVIGVALVWGFLIVGSPFAARLRKIDERRVDDLRTIHSAIQRMVTERVDTKVRLKRPLPKTLDDVAAYVQSEQDQKKPRLHDPDTNEAYAYKVRSETEYELCATFASVRDQKQDLFWNHPAGPRCFVFDAVEDETKRLAVSGMRAR
jgi:hypothetical protein